MTLLIVAAGSLAYGLLLGRLVGILSPEPKSENDLSRKAFHVGIFTGAAPAQLLQGYWGVVVYGTVIAALVLLAYLRGSRSVLYRALARPEDGGAGARFVLVPLASTALGGILGLQLVGSFAVVGYLVCGWGDAAGEVVGRRWGRRRYGVPPWARSPRYFRSLEGSLAVLVAGSLGGWVGLSLLGYSPLPSLAVGLACGALGSVSEALSSHGTDNLWVQLLPSLGGWWLLG